MQHQLGRVVGAVFRVAHRPVIADGVREDGAVAVEIGRGDGAAGRREALQALVRDAVPEVKRAVRSRRAEGRPVLRMKADVVDGPHLDDLLGIGLVAVAPEGEVDAGVDLAVLPSAAVARCSAPEVLLGHGVDSASPLYPCRSPASPVGKGRHGACLVLERRLRRARERRGVGMQVDEMNVSFGRRDDEQTVGRVHAVDAVRAAECRESFSRLAEIPVPNRLVPGAGSDDGARR